MKLLVRRLSDRKVVHEVEVSSARSAERVMRGMLINLDSANYYIDDSQIKDDKEAQA